MIVVTYNSSKTVIETLESIKNQTYPTLELIITDDCSTDNTIKLIKEWLYKNHKRFFNVRILSARKNHGVTKNCNIGIFQAKGKYIQIIAGDDILLEQAVEKRYEFSKKNSLSVVFSKVELFGANIARINMVKRYCERGYDIIKKGWQEQYNNIIEENFIVGPSGGFYLAKYIKRIHGFDIRYPMLEDYPFIYHYIVGGNEIILMDEVLVKYRVSNSSIWASDSSAFKKSNAKFFFYERLVKMLKNGKFEEAIKQMNIWLPVMFAEK